MGGLKLGKEAAEKYANAQTQADFEGFLEKKGAKRKNWNKRWFVLKENYLFYTKKQGDPPQGIINLHGATITETQGPTTRANSFSLLAPKSVSVDAKWTNRTFFICAGSQEEMKKWSAAMVKASHFKGIKSKVKEENGEKKPEEKMMEDKKPEEKMMEDKKPEEKMMEVKIEQVKIEQKMDKIEIEEKKVEIKVEMAGSEKMEKKQEEKKELDLPPEPKKEDEKKMEIRESNGGENSDSESSEEEKS